MGAVAWLAVLGALRVTLAAPERCDPPDASELRSAAAEAVAWFERNQNDDGRWLYGYDRDADEIDRAYNIVRHAGVSLSLAQALRRGYPSAGPALDAGLDYALANLVVVDDDAVAFGVRSGHLEAGSSALLVAALVERRLATGDDVHDDVLVGLGRFLERQVEPDGRVLARWDPNTGAPVPDVTSPFYTGESLWALARLHTVFPEDGWDDSVRRIAHYLATERDDREPRYPPVSDHWAAYAYDEMAHWPDGNGLTETDESYAQRQAELFSVQARNEAQKSGDLMTLTHGGDVVGAGIGTWGEGLGALWRAGAEDAAVGQLRPELAASALCVADVLVGRQASAAEARDDAAPGMVDGAWFTDGRTQMDDQQHSLSALLASIEIVDQERSDPDEGPGP